MPGSLFIFFFFFFWSYPLDNWRYFLVQTLCHYFLRQTDLPVCVCFINVDFHSKHVAIYEKRCMRTVYYFISSKLEYKVRQNLPRCIIQCRDVFGGWPLSLLTATILPAAPLWSVWGIRCLLPIRVDKTAGVPQILYTRVFLDCWQLL